MSSYIKYLNPFSACRVSPKISNDTQSSTLNNSTLANSDVGRDHYSVSNDEPQASSNQDESMNKINDKYKAKKAQSLNHVNFSNKIINKPQASSKKCASLNVQNNAYNQEDIQDHAQYKIKEDKKINFNQKDRKQLNNHKKSNLIKPNTDHSLVFDKSNKKESNTLNDPMPCPNRRNSKNYFKKNYNEFSSNSKDYIKNHHISDYNLKSPYKNEASSNVNINNESNLHITDNIIPNKMKINVNSNDLINDVNVKDIKLETIQMRVYANEHAWDDLDKDLVKFYKKWNHDKKLNKHLYTKFMRYQNSN